MLFHHPEERRVFTGVRRFYLHHAGGLYLIRIEQRTAQVWLQISFNVRARSSKKPLLACVIERPEPRLHIARNVGVRKIFFELRRGDQGVAPWGIVSDDGIGKSSGG